MTKRTQHGFGVLEIIIIVVIIGIIAALGWVFFMKKHETPEQSAQKKNTSQSNELEPQAVTKKIKESLSKTYTLLDIDKNDQPQDKEASIRTDEASPPYKVDGYDYYVTYRGGSSLFILRPENASDTTLPSKSDAEIRREVEKQYHEAGLDSIESRKDNAGNLTNVFTGKGLICTVEAPSAAVQGSTASCGTLASYPATAAQMKPFSEILEHADETTILAGTIKNSKAAGYQIAEISVGNIQGGGGAVALLWKQGVRNWTLFRYTQQVVPCQAFDTSALKHAFEGEPCVDEVSGQARTVAAGIID